MRVFWFQAGLTFQSETQEEQDAMRKLVKSIRFMTWREAAADETAQALSRATSETPESQPLK